MSANPAAQFRRGATAASEIVKGGAYARAQFFGIEDTKVAHLRFLTDAEPDPSGAGGWITVLQHQNIATKGAPAGFTGNWPTHMSAVCRYDPAFTGIYTDCYICDFLVDGKKVKKPGGRVWALACLREQVIGDGTEELGGPDMNGKRVGLRDQVREVVIPARDAQDGQPARSEQTVKEKAVVIVNMGYKNFFAVVQAYYGRNGTVLDRDFWIKRMGAGLDTQYQIVGEDPIIVNGEVMDLRNPEFMKRYETDLVLEEVISARATDEFYARFFDTRFTASDEGKVTETGNAPEPKPETEMTEEMMSAIAGRVKGYEPPADAPATDGAPAPEPQAEPAPAGAGGGMKDFG